MTNLKTALLKLKTEASERRENLAEDRDWSLLQGPFIIPATDREAYRKGFDSRQKEIDVLISIVEKQAEALEYSGREGCIQLVYDRQKQTQSDVLALLSGIEGKP